jgi:hypothetical protein
VRAKRPGKPRRGEVHDPAFVAWVHENYGCLVLDTIFAHGSPVTTVCKGRLTFHHWRKNGSPKNDRRGFILCQGHHLHDFGPHSIERLGKDKWLEMFGIDPEAVMADYVARFCIAKEE